MAVDRAFLDTNVVLALLENKPERAAVARSLLLEPAVISVQVLNEAFNVGVKKLRAKPELVSDFLDELKSLCEVVPLSVDVHDQARRLHAQYQLAWYDALIVAAAHSAGCTTLWSEDMHHGLVIHRTLTLRNPFQS